MSAAGEPLPSSSPRGRTRDWPLALTLQPRPEHPPLATLFFIGLCLAAMLLATPETLAEYGLRHGDGFHPLQWLTANFLHADWLQLTINMLSLLLLGRLVEGRLGPLRFTLLSLWIGLGECALEQTFMLGAAEGRSVGASAVAFGLLTFGAAVWPRGGFGLRFTSGGREREFGVALWVWAAAACGSQLVLILFLRPRPGAAEWHLLGGALGLAAGLAVRRFAARRRRGGWSGAWGPGLGEDGRTERSERGGLSPPVFWERRARQRRSGLRLGEVGGQVSRVTTFAPCSNSWAKAMLALQCLTRTS